MAQMQTVSIRLPDEDFRWLLSMQDGVGKTASERLRALIAQVREQESGLSDPDACMAWMRNLVLPMANLVASWERQHKAHSDLMSAVLDIVPRIMAVLVSARSSSAGDEDGDLREIEAALAQHCFRLFTTVLRAMVTSAPAVYDKEAIERYLPDIVEITEIITTRREKERSNG
ncbi:hypothetical protein [Propionivibrio sp.]|uniref:hypothetical protein n=1 Tax=Propionivibrio sp. TaxID=2212460 RepID=UPI0039E61BA1